VAEGADRLIPQSLLLLPPARSCCHENIKKARLAQAFRQVNGAQPGTKPLVGRIGRLPAGERDPATALEHPADLGVGLRGLVGELDGVGAERDSLEGGTAYSGVRGGC
jgi:hypothetical protein